VPRYINVHFTYLLTYSASSSICNSFMPMNLASNSQHHSSRKRMRHGKKT